MFAPPSEISAALSREFVRRWPDARFSAISDRESLGDVVVIRVHAKGREATGNVCLRQPKGSLSRDLQRLVEAIVRVIDNIRDNPAHDSDMAGRLEAALS